MSSINFDNVYLLFIAIPLLALLLVPFFIAVKKENANWHNIASAVIHVVLAILIAFTAAGTSIETTMTETNVYVLADVSYSSSKNLTTIDNYIEGVSKNLPRNSKLGVVCFGKNAEMYVGLGKKLKPVEGAVGTLVDDTETDIEGALEYAGSLFRDNVVKRVVLITDGKQSHLSDSNALRRAVDTLRASDVYVDAIYLDNNVTDDVKEVQIDGVEYTQQCYLNHEETATVAIRSTYKTQAKLSLYLQGEQTPIDEKTISLEVGSNEESFTLPTVEKGAFDYEVRVAASLDESPYNNNVKFSQTVSDQVKVLLLTSSQEERQTLQQAYGDNATIDAYVDETAVPCSVEELCRYDEIVISNFDVAKVENTEMFLSSVNAVVSLFGKSLVTYGDLSLQTKNADDWEKVKTLQDMLPVRFGNAARDAKLYAIVVDASRSMETNSRFALAKRAAKQLVQYLQDGDEVTVVSFNGSFKTEVSPTVVGEDSKADVYAKIDAISAKHGTSIGLGLNQAYKELENLDYAQRQVMLITDGLTFSMEADDPMEVAQKMARKAIALSVIDVGRNTDTSPTAQAAQRLLENLAQTGGGEYFFASTSNELDQVMFGDIAADATESIIKKKSSVKVKRSSDAVLENVSLASEYIEGYVYNTSKASATTVLVTEYVKDSGETIEVPLYAYWSYGNGKVSTFSSAISGEWMPWQGVTTRTFFSNVLSVNTPKEKVDYPFTAELREENGYISAELTPAMVRKDATATITVTYPGENGATETTQTKMTFSSLRYAYRFSADRLGKYTVKIEYAYGGKTYESNFTYTLTYLPEYDAFAGCDSSVLHKMLGSEGTVSENGYLNVDNSDVSIGKYVFDLTLPSLIACAVLFIADVVIRKLKWEDIRSLFGKGKK